MTVLLVVSNDHWGAQAEACVPPDADIVVAIDRSGGLSRSLRLVARRSIPVPAAARILLAQRKLPRDRPRSRSSLASNADLQRLAQAHGARDVLLFRAGLIISGETLTRCDVRNIHCADIHGFGGLAAIWRALQARAFDQKATLHRVTNRIDEGEVLDTEPFTLDPRLGYAANEHLAYQAGLRLLARTLRRLQAPGTS